jgi:hypothetical protein
MEMCDKCKKMGGIVLLVLGLLFLLQDLGVWGFWDISWYTALFILVGAAKLCSGACPECRALQKGSAKKGRK